MLQAYIRGAMARAHCEILEDDDSYYGEIPQFDGVYANEESLERCREPPRVQRRLGELGLEERPGDHVEGVGLRTNVR